MEKHYHEGDYYVIGIKGFGAGPIAGPFGNLGSAKHWLGKAIGIDPGCFVSQYSHDNEVGSWPKVA